MSETGPVMVWAVVGAAASILSFVAAVVLFEADDAGTIGQALGFYFLAKAFFLGPMLYLTGRIAAQTGTA